MNLLHVDNALVMAVADPAAEKAPGGPRRTGRLDQLQAQLERLMARARFAVIHGGNRDVEGAVINPTTHTRSWKSYEAVAWDLADAMERLGFAHVEVLAEDMRLGERLREHCIHLAWLNSGGVQGYDPVSHGPAMLEMFGIPYLGHDPLIASTLDNKHAFKRELRGLGIPTAPFMTWHMGRGYSDPRQSDRFARIFGDYDGPFVVKPVSGRASLHVHVVHEAKDLAETVMEVYQATSNHVLIEKYLAGREFCVAVCGPIISTDQGLRNLEQPFVFSALERVLNEDEEIFTSMDLRPITTERVHYLDEANDGPILAELEKIARVVFEELGLETLVRLDLRADEEGNLFVLEANPKPDLKAPTDQGTSLVAAGLEAKGMTYEDLILSLLADRIDLLFSQKRGTVHHLLTLLE